MPLLLAILAPASFDLVCFNEKQFANKVSLTIPADYISKTLVQSRLNNGFEVCFAHYIRPQQHFGTPEKLDLSPDVQVFD